MMESNIMLFIFALIILIAAALLINHYDYQNIVNVSRENPTYASVSDPICVNMSEEPKAIYDTATATLVNIH